MIGAKKRLRSGLEECSPGKPRIKSSRPFSNAAAERAGTETTLPGRGVDDIPALLQSGFGRAFPRLETWAMRRRHRALSRRQTCAGYRTHVNLSPAAA